MKCFYHASDLDGICSAAIVKYFNSECELIPINYDDIFPWDIISGQAEKETIYMVDFSLKAVDMQRLNDISNLIWIDHHETALEAYGELYESKSKVPRWWPINGIRDVTLAGCELVWRYLAPQELANEPIPRAVYLLGRYDVWDHTDPDTIPFQHGMKLFNPPPNNQTLWSRLFEGDGIGNLVANGYIIKDYVKQDNAKYAETMAFEAKFWYTTNGDVVEYRAIAINRHPANSQIFDSVYDEDKHDLMVAFSFVDGIWRVSLYSTKEGVHAGNIAKAHGGGGHPGAAGFSLKSETGSILTFLEPI